MSQVTAKSRTRKRPRRADKSRRPVARKASRGAAASKSAATAEQRIGQGGRRLSDAFDAVSSMPVLAESRRRLLLACEEGRPSAGEIADAVESDVALTIAVMRAAGDAGGRGVEPGGPAGGRGVYRDL
jgi:hypothetical protein